MLREQSKVHYLFIYLYIVSFEQKNILLLQQCKVHAASSRDSWQWHGVACWLLVLSVSIPNLNCLKNYLLKKMYFSVYFFQKQLYKDVEWVMFSHNRFFSMSAMKNV